MASTYWWLLFDAEPESVTISDSAGSTDNDSDELTKVEAEPWRQPKEDHSLMVDLLVTVFQSVEGEYVSDAEQDIETACLFRCTCKSNDGNPGYLLFTPEEMVKRRDQMN